MLFIYIDINSFAKKELSITESNSTHKNHLYVCNFPLQYVYVVLKFSFHKLVSVINNSTEAFHGFINLK